MQLPLRQHLAETLEVAFLVKHSMQSLFLFGATFLPFKTLLHCTETVGKPFEFEELNSAPVANSEK